MKLSGMAGTGSGKLGSQVYASVAGEQIVRNYQPKVSNPNTSLQVNQRARLKLLSQLSAVFSPILAYKKQGLVSARNMFVKRNFALTSGNDGQAQVTIENLQLTAGTAGLPGIKATRSGALFVNVELLTDASLIVDRVVYVFFRKTAQNTLQLIESHVVTEAGEAGVFPTSVMYLTGDLVIYAYGMKDLNSRAAAVYGSYSVESGEDIAKLFMSRKLDFNSYRFTKTRGCQLYNGEDETQSISTNQARIFVTPSGSGSVMGGGVYTRGEIVQLTATPAEGSSFIGWLENGSDTFFAYSPTLQVKADALVDIIAVFQNPNSSTGGIDGYDMTNPLPYDDAEVNIDGVDVDIKEGHVALASTFDNIGVRGIGEGHSLVFVPQGSVLGDDDNLAFEPGAVMDYEYGVSITNTYSGAVYLDGKLFFYVFTEAETPWVDAQVAINGNTVDVSSGSVTVENADLDSITIQRGEERYVVKVRQENGLTKTFDVERNQYFVDEVTAPCTVYVNGFKFFDIELGWANPYPEAELRFDGISKEITENVDCPLGAEYFSISGLPENVVVTATNNGAYFPMAFSNSEWKNTSEGIEIPLDIFVDGTLWFTIVYNG